MSNAIYDCVDKYIVTASCKGPLHVGGASGDNFDILIHPVKGRPFIQAAGICGVLREYCLKITDEETVDQLFGGIESDRESKVKITDGVFTEGKDVKIELRPHVRLDPDTGTVSDAAVKGGDKEKSGQKFDMQYVAAGSEFSFALFLYGGKPHEEELVRKIFAALNAGEIQIGGKKSSGCGYLDEVTVMHRRFDMKNQDDRTDWITESGLSLMQLPTLKPEDCKNAYEIKILASTEGELLVKAIAPEGPEEDASNIQNAKGEYIIPGSSIKGAFRNRMETIATYMKVNPALLSDGFGKASETGADGKVGNLRFSDIVVGGADGTNTNLRTRIRIDKFTGGVRNQALFSELNIFGDMEIDIRVANESNPDAVTALLLLAIRDLYYKLFSLGGGQSVGKGYLNMKEVSVTDKRTGDRCFFDQDFAITEGTSMLEKCMTKLREQVTV